MSVSASHTSHFVSDAKNEEKKYFRLMHDPRESWGAYRETPIYDDYPILGSFKSTIHLPSPRAGDYLVQGQDGRTYALRPYDPECFDDIEFDSQPPLEELLAKGDIVQVPESIRQIDFILQDKIAHLNADICAAEIAVEDLELDMEERRFGFPTKAARQAKLQYPEAKKELDVLTKEYSQLEKEYEEKVIKPFAEAQKGKNNRVSLDQKISDATGRCQPHADIVKNSPELGR